MDFLNHREGGVIFYPFVLLFPLQCTIPHCRNCKRLHEFEEIEISSQSCRGCWDPIVLILYRERASQPARMKRRRNRRRVESGKQASRCCLFTSYQGRHASPKAVLGAAHTPPPPPFTTSSTWLVMPPVSLLICASPAPFDTAPRWPRPRGPNGGSFERGDQNEQFSPSQLFDQSSRS
jgi:hypothetical protein